MGSDSGKAEGRDWQRQGKAHFTCFHAAAGGFAPAVTSGQYSPVIVPALQNSQPIMKRLLPLLALLAGALCWQPAAAQAAKPIVVAHPVDFSGPGADFGRDFSLGAKVYFDHINAGGGIKGRRLVYRSSDTGGQPARVLDSVRALLAERGDAVIFGVAGDHALALLARDGKLRGAGVPLFGAVAGNSALGPEDGVFHLRAGLADEIRAIVGQLKNLGIASFGLAGADEYLREAAETLLSESRQQGVQLISQVALPTSPEGAAAAATKIAAARPQAVIVIGDTLSAAQFFKRYRSLDPGAFLCAPSLVNVRTLTSAIGAQAARGLIISQVVPDPAAPQEISREHKRLMNKYADEPSSPATLEGFIAAKLLVTTLQKSPDASASTLRQTLYGEGRISLGGYELNFSRGGGRPSRFVELSVISRDGRLLR